MSKISEKRRNRKHSESFPYFMHQCIFTTSIVPLTIKPLPISSS